MKTDYENLIQDPEFRRLLAVESLALAAATTISALMHDQNVTKAELARRLGKSRPWVTQLLNGKSNMTLETLALAAHALGAEIILSAQSSMPATLAPKVPTYRLAGDDKDSSQEYSSEALDYAA